MLALVCIHNVKKKCGRPHFPKRTKSNSQVTMSQPTPPSADNLHGNFSITDADSVGTDMYQLVPVVWNSISQKLKVTVSLVCKSPGVKSSTRWN